MCSAPGIWLSMASHDADRNKYDATVDIELVCVRRLVHG